MVNSPGLISSHPPAAILCKAIQTMTGFNAWLVVQLQEQPDRAVFLSEFQLAAIAEAYTAQSTQAIA